MPSKTQKGRVFHDWVDAAHNDANYTDIEKNALRQVFTQSVAALGGTDAFLDRNITLTFALVRGTSPSFSMSVSVT